MPCTMRDWTAGAAVIVVPDGRGSRTLLPVCRRNVHSRAAHAAAEAIGWGGGD